MGFNAMEEVFDVVEINGQPALFCDYRIDRNTVPDGWFFYELRGSDFDPGKAVTLEEHVGINHAGTILSPTEILFPDESKCLDIEDSLGFLCDECTIEEFNMERAMELMDEDKMITGTVNQPDDHSIEMGGLV